MQEESMQIELPSIGQNEEVKMALTALAEMVSQQGQNNASSNHLINNSLADIDPANLERPPWDTACYALEKASGKTPHIVHLVQS